MKLRVNHLFKNISFVLTLIFVLVILAEFYFIYFNLFTKLTVTDDAIIPNNIVRVDLKTYQDTIEDLDEAETFEANPIYPLRGNPFK
jgi:hypothetical protein